MGAIIFVADPTVKHIVSRRIMVVLLETQTFQSVHQKSRTGKLARRQKKTLFPNEKLNKIVGVLAEL